MSKLTRYDKDNIFAGSVVGLFAIGMAISCSTTKKSAEQQVYEDRQKHIALLHEAREAYPCDTSTVYITKTDTAFVFVSDTTRIGDTVYITKYKTINNTVTKQVTVVDSAALHELRLSGLQKDYLLQNCQEGADKLAAENKAKDDKIASLQPYKTGVVVLSSAIGLFLLLFGFLKFKSFI